MVQQEKHYAALAPILALMGLFIHPMASTILPLVLFFIFYWLRREAAQLVALRTADLVFTVQLFRAVIWLLFTVSINFIPTTANTALRIDTAIIIVVLIFLVASLIYGAVQTLRGKEFKYPLSLRIAERVYNAVTKKKNPS
jgi:uncharacterized Tic20 family protein